MALVRCEGIVVRTYPLGETSRIVVVYTREHGLLKLVAKGARKTPSRFGVSLEPLSRSRFVIYLKTDRDLQLVSQAERSAPTAPRSTTSRGSPHAQAAIELIDRLVWGEEAHDALFELLVRQSTRWRPRRSRHCRRVTLAFELQLAGLLGYRPRLDACAELRGEPVRAAPVLARARRHAVRSMRGGRSRAPSRSRPTRWPGSRCCCRARWSRRVITSR